MPDDVNTIQAEDGTTLVEIASVGSQDEANLLRGFLEAEGIPAQIENVKFNEMPTTVGAMGDIRVYVVETDKDRAVALLRERRDEWDQLDDDTETVVTDEGEAAIDDDAETEPS